METQITSPKFGIDICRAIVKNNQGIDFIIVDVITSNKWLPQILTDIGLFPSNGQVKKNRPDLWRELSTERTSVEFPWCQLNIIHES